MNCQRGGSGKNEKWQQLQQKNLQQKNRLQLKK